MTAFHLARFIENTLSASDALGICLTAQTAEKLVRYLQALSLWNTKFNLTAIKDPEQMLIKHIFDSLSILPHLPSAKSSPRLLDVGTGAGLPALIVAICEPTREVVALDSNSKKVRFMRQVVGELGLSNASPVHVRLDAKTLDTSLGTFDVITSRAFASLTDFVKLTQAYLKTTGALCAMKGVAPSHEIDTLSTDWRISTTKLHVPSLNEARCLVTLSR